MRPLDVISDIRKWPASALHNAKFIIARAIYTCGDEPTEWQLRMRYARLRDEIEKRGHK